MAMQTPPGHKTVCPLCGSEDDRRRAFQVDHICPLALGGANAFHNFQLTCWPCNSRKGKDKTNAEVREWNKRNGFMVNEALALRVARV